MVAIGGNGARLQTPAMDKLFSVDQQILFDMYESGQPIDSIAEKFGVSTASVNRYLLLSIHEETYAHAKIIRSHALVSRMHTEAENRTSDYITQPDGKVCSNPSAIGRSKLICDVLKWSAQVANPEYRDKQVVEMDASGPLSAFLSTLMATNQQLPITSGRTIEHDDE